MPIDSYLAEQFRHLADVPDYETAEWNPRAAESLELFRRDPAPWTMPDVDVRAFQIGEESAVGVRAYTPRAPRAAKRTLIWIHGGGFGAGSIDMNESHVVGSELAHRAGVEVISVDYRLAGNGVLYPAPLDDVATVWRWAVRRADSMGTRLPAIGGGSAGANLAAGAVVRAMTEGGDPPSHVLLAYPVLHFPVPAIPFELAREMDEGVPSLLRFPPESIEAMYARYVGRVSCLPLESTPAHAPLKGFPPTTVVLSEYDDLRSSGELFIRQLQDSGVTVNRFLARGMVHGHLDRTPALAGVDESLDVLATALASETDSI